jgi:hypothetical protein
MALVVEGVSGLLYAAAVLIIVWTFTMVVLGRW